jgi:hypothetical protein
VTQLGVQRLVWTAKVPYSEVESVESAATAKYVYQVGKLQQRWRARGKSWH